MSTKLIKVGNSFNVPQKTYICNTEEERDNLKAYFGDLCLVIDDGITYILNSEDEWYPYPTGGGGGGDVSSDTIAPVYDSVETAYAQNELIMYDSQLYRAKQAISAPAGDFDSTKWEKVDIASTKADLISGKVPASQLPSYVDDVIEGYYNEGIFYSDSTFETPIVGEAGKIYVDLLTNNFYRWSGSTYIQVGSSQGGVGATEIVRKTTTSNVSNYTPAELKDLVDEGQILLYDGSIVTSYAYVEDEIDSYFIAYTFIGAGNFGGYKILNNKTIQRIDTPVRPMLQTEIQKLGGIETGAEVNKIIDVRDSNGRSLVNENKIAIVPSSSSNALSTEEMMTLFADTGLTETAGVEYVEYTEDPNGDYVYDEELGEYRLYEEGDTGTRYSADAAPAGYVEYVEDENGDYVWDETTQTYRPYEEGDTGTRYAVGQSYILIY